MTGAAARVLHGERNITGASKRVQRVGVNATGASRQAQYHGLNVAGATWLPQHDGCILAGATLGVHLVGVLLTLFLRCGGVGAGGAAPVAGEALSRRSARGPLIAPLPPSSVL